MNSLVKTLHTFDEQLSELSDLQMAYEKLARVDWVEAQDVAAELSNAVGRFLIEYGREAIV